MIKYENKKTGAVVDAVLNKDGKYEVEERVLAVSTFKKQYRKIEVEDVVEEELEQEEEVEKIDTIAYTIEILEAIAENDADVIFKVAKRSITVRVENKPFMHIWRRKNSIRIYISEDNLSRVEVMGHDITDEKGKMNKAIYIDTNYISDAMNALLA
jgi:hypothetical protein